jgi:hypothetical protein
MGGDKHKDKADQRRPTDVVQRRGDVDRTPPQYWRSVPAHVRRAIRDLLSEINLNKWRQK